MVKPKYPKGVGACVDLLYTMRADRLARQREVDAMKAAEAELETHIFAQFDKQELAGAKGAVATAAVKQQTVVELTDFDAFLAHVAKTKQWDMLPRRALDSAVKERWAAGKEVPGTAPFVKVSLSLTKV